MMVRLLRGRNRLGDRLAVVDSALTLRAQHLELVDDDLGGVAPEPVLSIPLMTAKPALGIDQLASCEELLADPRQPIEGYERVILHVLLPVTIVVFRVA